MAASPVGTLYDTAIDRDSAFEMLARRARDKQLDAERARLEAEDAAAREAEARRTEREPVVRRSTRQTPAEAAMNSFARTVANRLGTALVRGILGGLKGRR